MYLPSPTAKEATPSVGFLVTDGIVVHRSQHTGDIGVEPVAILLADDLLKNDGHLLLVDDVARSRHIRFRVLEEHRGVDTFDGTGQHPQHLVLVVEPWNHIGVVDSGKGLIMRILQKRRRPYGDRTLRGVEESEEVANQGIGQLCLEKAARISSSLASLSAIW